MNRQGKLALVLLGMALIGCAKADGYVAKTDSHTTEHAAGDVSSTAKGVTLRDDMRKLWSDHVIWTRQYINAAVANEPTAAPAAERLMKNQEDIGKAIVPFYGEAAGTKLTDLLKQHITIAVDLVKAAKSGDKAKLTDGDKRWHDNAAEIATFLSGANPNWNKEAVLAMLNEHLTLTTEELTTRIEKKWAENTAVFDKIYDQALMMADAMADGIIKQFPNKV